MRYLLYPLTILMSVVAVMSGPLSILREAVATFYPGRFPIVDVFGHSFMVAFVISGGALLIIKEVEIHGLKEQLDKNRPELSADFNVSAVAPAGKDDRDSIVAIAAHITNAGAPSIIKNIEVLVKTDTLTVAGEFISLDKRGSMFGEVVNGVTIAHVIALEDHLVRNCSAQPVPTGGGAIGAHVVLVRGIDHDAVYRNGTIVMLSFEDFTGRKYEFTKVMPGEIKTPVSPIGLQE